MPELAGLLHSISVWLLPALLAITLHEAAHGYVANALGDPTARLAGRLSLNPMRYLRSPRRDMAIVAAAGPLINLAMALIAALLLHGLQYMPDVASDWARENLLNAIKFNVILAVFNLMPIPPLDGGRVAVGVLPLFLARPLARLENIGMLIVMGFAFIIPMVSAQAGYPLNPLGWLLSGPINAAIVAILTLAGW